MTYPPYNPDHVNMVGLGCSRFARRYLGNRKCLLPDLNGDPQRGPIDQKENTLICFLFLQVLRCFTSLGALRLSSVSCGTRGVSPFGHFRVKDCLASYRNLSQPYHVLHRFLKPRHPPYTLHSRRECCTPLYNFLSVLARIQNRARL